MTKMNFDKVRYYYIQCCSTCKFNVNDLCSQGIFAHEVVCDDFVCDFYKLSRSKAKQNLKKRGDIK